MDGKWQIGFAVYGALLGGGGLIAFWRVAFYMGSQATLTKQVGDAVLEMKNGFAGHVRENASAHKEIHEKVNSVALAVARIENGGGNGKR